MKIYRIAILGCRSRGTATARAYHHHPRAEVVGLCDLVTERLEGLGAELGVEALFYDLDEMIRSVNPDIVAIPTGTEFHYDLAMRVLAHGCHIDIEKPLCPSLTEVDEVLALAKSQGVRIAVHHQGRSGAAMRAVHKALQEGRIGDLRYLQGSGKGYYGGFGLMNIGTHMLNNMMALAGHCVAVNAILTVDGRPSTPQDVLPSPGGMGYITGESVTASLEFVNGVSGTLLQHRFGTMDSTAYALEVYGSEGRLFWRSTGAWILDTPHEVPGGNGWQSLPLEYPSEFNPASSANEADYGFVDEFIYALDEGREHQSSGAEAGHIVEILMGVFESGAYGRRVKLPQQNRCHPLLRWREEAGLSVPEAMPRDYRQWLTEEDQRLGRA